MTWSHPSRVRGLKHTGMRSIYNGAIVAPFTGAWIETSKTMTAKQTMAVAPFTGAWIETLPYENLQIQIFVAPFTGAWIETLKKISHSPTILSRTLHGCVD